MVWSGDDVVVLDCALEEPNAFCSRVVSRAACVAWGRTKFELNRLGALASLLLSSQPA